MSGGVATAPLLGGVALLERAVNYALGSLRLVTPGALVNPTPCHAWNLRALLLHLDDSLQALCEAAECGAVAPAPMPPAPSAADDPVAAVRDQACRLLGAWTTMDSPDPIAVSGKDLTAGVITSAGALELAGHGWDVAAAVHGDHPIPPALAQDLLDLAPLLVTEADRPSIFAPPIPVPRAAPPATRLLAHLGRPT